MMPSCSDNVEYAVMRERETFTLALKKFTVFPFATQEAIRDGDWYTLPRIVLFLFGQV